MKLIPKLFFDVLISYGQEAGSGDDIPQRYKTLQNRLYSGKVQLKSGSVFINKNCLSGSPPPLDVSPYKHHLFSICVEVPVQPCPEYLE